MWTMRGIPITSYVLSVKGAPLKEVPKALHFAPSVPRLTVVATNGGFGMNQILEPSPFLKRAVGSPLTPLEVGNHPTEGD